MINATTITSESTITPVATAASRNINGDATVADNIGTLTSIPGGTMISATETTITSTTIAAESMITPITTSGARSIIGDTTAAESIGTPSRIAVYTLETGDTNAGETTVTPITIPENAVISAGTTDADDIIARTTIAAEIANTTVSSELEESSFTTPMKLENQTLIDTTLFLSNIATERSNEETTLISSTTSENIVATNNQVVTSRSFMESSNSFDEVSSITLSANDYILSSVAFDDSTTEIPRTEDNSLGTTGELDTGSSTTKQQTVSFASVDSNLDLSGTTLLITSSSVTDSSSAVSTTGEQILLPTLSDLSTQTSKNEASTMIDGLVTDSTIIVSFSDEETRTRSMFNTLETLQPTSSEPAINVETSTQTSRTCYTPSPFTSSDVIWSTKISYPITYFENSTVSDQPCFFQGIIGERSALQLSADLQEYVTVAYPFDFRNIGFSISAWIYLNSSQSEMTIFMQYDPQITSNYLFLTLTDMKIQFGFDSLFTNGSTTLQIDYWHHIAFVYDNISQTQIVYLDGIEDGNTSSTPYLSDPCNITIGRGLETTETYFDGLIDRISILNRVMTADEVLEEATLSAYYSFNTSIGDDFGPNDIEGTSVGVYMASQQNLPIAALFGAGPESYLQAKSFLLLGVSQYSYSFSFWIKPSQFHTKGSIIHLSSNNDWCLPMLGFSALGELIAQSSDGNIQQITGSQPPTHVWTHIALTYQYGDKLRLYQNGSLIGSTNQFNYTINESPVTFTLGFAQSQTGCMNSLIVPGLYAGFIEEFQIYSRCLSIADIQTIMALFVDVQTN